jgi:hypothetical protein
VITCIRPSGPHGVQQNGYEITEVVAKKGKAAAASMAAAKAKNGNNGQNATTITQRNEKC